MGRITRAERRAEALALRAQGLSTAQIAAAMGLKSASYASRLVAGTEPPEWTKRPRAKDELRERCIELRRQGLSYREIRAELGEGAPSKSSLSLWLSDVPLSDEQAAVLANRASSGNTRRNAANRALRQARFAKMRAVAHAEIGSLSDRELFLAGVVAYWAEGSKNKPWSRGDSSVTFINADANMIRLFLRWAELVGWPLERLRFTVHIHESANVVAAQRYWREVTGASDDQFRRPSLKRHNPATVRKNTGDSYNGCLIVYLRQSGDLNRRIEGWWFGLMDGIDSSVATI